MFYTTLASLIIACGSSTTSDKEISKSIQEVQATLPKLPEPYRQELLNLATSVDIIFYSLPVSMSQDDRHSISKTINFALDKSAGQLDPTCKSIGRISLLSAGETMQDIELYFSPRCRYFVYLEDGKPKYANQISPGGFNFLNNILEKFGNIPGVN